MGYLIGERGMSLKKAFGLVKGRRERIIYKKLKIEKIEKN